MELFLWRSERIIQTVRQWAPVGQKHAGRSTRPAPSSPKRRVEFLVVVCVLGFLALADCADPLRATWPTGDSGTDTGGVLGFAGAAGSGGSIETGERIPIAGTIVEFPIPTARSGPVGITAGPDGNLWFTEFDGDNIGRVTPDGTITEFALPAFSGATDIAAGADGNVWFTERGSQRAPYSVLGGNNIGRISPAGMITHFAVPTARSQPAGIAAAPGNGLWFTEAWAIQIGRIVGSDDVSSPTVTIKEYSVPSLANGLNGGPGYIAAGPDGNLWFTEYDAGRIGRMAPWGIVTEFPLPSAGGHPADITAGPDGNLWFTDPGANSIGRISVTGSITEFPIPTAQSDLYAITAYGITAGPDGNLWFVEGQGNKLGRITPTGAITEFLLPAAKSYPADITAGPDGNLWFTEGGSNKIGRITP